MSVDVKKKGTKESKLSYIGTVLSSNTIRMKVSNCLQDLTAPSAVIGI
jgi:hypothetical protein